MKLSVVDIIWLTKALRAFWLQYEYVIHKVLVGSVRRPVIGQDPWHASLGSSLDNLALSLLRGVSAQGDDERVMAFECLDNGLLLAVVDGFRSNSVGELALAADSRNRCNCVLAGLE